MKASEYAERYKANPTDKALVEVAMDMLIESKKFIEQRNAKTDAAVYAILDELNSKYRAFVRLVGDETILLDGFERFVALKMEFVVDGWKASRDKAKMRAK